MEHNASPKKKGDLLSLGRLAAAKLETPAINNDDDVPSAGSEGEEQLNRVVEPTTSAFRSFMTPNVKFKNDKTIHSLLYIGNHERLSALAKAEKTEMIVVMNNIIDRWFKKYREDCIKSIENTKVKF